MLNTKFVCPAYLNCVPFIDGLKSGVIETKVPKEIEKLFEEGTNRALFLPVANEVELAGKFKPLGQLGLAARKSAKSVYLFSTLESKQLSGATVLITKESRTSVELLKVVANELWQTQNINYTTKAGAHSAELLIGDKALLKKSQKLYKYTYDLAKEWTKLCGYGFVFARWVAPSSMNDELLFKTTYELTKNLEKNLKNLDELSKRYEKPFISSSDLKVYWENFNYLLNHDDFLGLTLFKSKLDSHGTYTPKNIT